MHVSLNGPRVVGAKQTTKALKDQIVQVLYIAKDAEDSKVSEALNLARLQNVPIKYIETMELLGHACNINVRTATAALINH